MTTRDYMPERRYAALTPGASLRIARELQGLSQSELARRTGIAQSAISAFESGSQEMGLKRIRVLAEALDVPPAAIAFPDYPTRPAASTQQPARDLYGALLRNLARTGKQHADQTSRAKLTARKRPVKRAAKKRAESA